MIALDMAVHAAISKNLKGENLQSKCKIFSSMGLKSIEKMCRAVNQNTPAVDMHGSIKELYNKLVKSSSLRREAVNEINYRISELNERPLDTFKDNSCLEEIKNFEAIECFKQCVEYLTMNEARLFEEKKENTLEVNSKAGLVVKDKADNVKNKSPKQNLSDYRKFIRDPKVDKVKALQSAYKAILTAKDDKEILNQILFPSKEKKEEMEQVCFSLRCNSNSLWKQDITASTLKLLVFYVQKTNLPELKLNLWNDKGKLNRETFIQALSNKLKNLGKDEVYIAKLVDSIAGRLKNVNLSEVLEGMLVLEGKESAEVCVEQLNFLASQNHADLIAKHFVTIFNSFKTSAKNNLTDTYMVTGTDRVTGIGRVIGLERVAGSDRIMRIFASMPRVVKRKVERQVNKNSFDPKYVTPFISSILNSDEFACWQNANINFELKDGTLRNQRFDVNGKYFNFAEHPKAQLLNTVGKFEERKVTTIPSDPLFSLVSQRQVFFKEKTPNLAQVVVWPDPLLNVEVRYQLNFTKPIQAFELQSAPLKGIDNLIIINHNTGSIFMHMSPLEKTGAKKEVDFDTLKKARKKVMNKMAEMELALSLAGSTSKKKNFSEVVSMLQKDENVDIRDYLDRFDDNAKKMQKDLRLSDDQFVDEIEILLKANKYLNARE